MLKFLSFVAQYWFIILWVAGIAITFIMRGWRPALAVATVGMSIVAFKLGRKTEREGHNARANNIQERREDAYQEIRDRNTSGSDVTDRLRKGDY